MTVLRASIYRHMPWKNGGGQTTEIAVFPAEAGLADFHWRVSMASVAADGPFSSFPGIDRTLSILDGHGLVLAVAGSPPERLTAKSDPFSFAADTATSATLIEGPVSDFNVMTRREMLTHSVRRFQSADGQDLKLSADQSLIFCHRGSVRIGKSEIIETLGPHDSMILPSNHKICVQPDGMADWFLVEFTESKKP